MSRSATNLQQSLACIGTTEKGFAVTYLHWLPLQVLAVEVLWTPQEEGDTFTRDELMTDYPKLNTL